MYRRKRLFWPKQIFWKLWSTRCCRRQGPKYHWDKTGSSTVTSGLRFPPVRGHFKEQVPVTNQFLPRSREKTEKKKNKHKRKNIYSGCYNSPKLLDYTIMKKKTGNSKRIRQLKGILGVIMCQNYWTTQLWKKGNNKRIRRLKGIGEVIKGQITVARWICNMEVVPPRLQKTDRVEDDCRITLSRW